MAAPSVVFPLRVTMTCLAQRIALRQLFSLDVGATNGFRDAQI
jgi:hypothetical protein